MNVALNKDFYGYDFLVTKDVLIPRPETEQLIDMVLNLAGVPYLPGVKPTKRILPEHPTILDVGTGSGCIAITLAKKLPEAKITACDISTPALAVAAKNARNLQVDIDFCHSDLLSKIDFTPDLIVANLPYVDATWDWLDQEALSQEPSLALYADDHGLALIKKLIDQASTRFVKHLILEADPCEHSSITSFAHKYKYSTIKTIGYILYLRYKK